MTQKSSAKLTLIFFVVVLASLVGLAIFWLDILPTPVIKPPAVDFYSCSQDSECVSVKADCCGCTAGGKATAINKNFQEKWNKKLSSDCRGIACIQVISNDPSCFKTPKCANNKCVLEDPTPTLKPTLTPTPSMELNFEPFLGGYFGEISEKKNSVITTQAEWMPISKKVALERSAPLPAVDFNKEMLIAVFQGEKSTGGYGIEITKIIENENNIEVFVKEAEPEPKCIVSQAFTRPYHIIKVKKSDKEVLFKTETVVTKCD